MCNRQEDLDFIPSQTVRAYAREIRHPFSDTDIATILYHAPPLSLERATLDKTDARKPLLEAAGQLLRGEGALNELFRASERYLAHTGKCGVKPKKEQPARHRLLFKDREELGEELL